eukprot:gene1318-11401_t
MTENGNSIQEYQFKKTVIMDTVDGVKYLGKCDQSKSRKKWFSMLLLVTGPPASGKGTQCEFIKEKFGLIHLSTGDMLREAIKNNTEDGLIAKEYIDKGDLVPDKNIMNMVFERLKKEDVIKNGYLLDGFPRSENQAKELIKNGFEPDCVLVIDVSDEEVKKRIGGRRIDPVTKNTYHMIWNKPPTKEIEERCIIRSDDNDETIKKRLKNYHSNSQSLYEAFGDKIKKIDNKGGNLKIEEVSASIEKVLKEL